MQGRANDSTQANEKARHSTRRQHHVWRLYLNAWATKNKLFCLQDGRVFEANPKDVAVERDFYKLSNVADVDIYGIRLMFKDAPPASRTVLQNFIDLFGLPVRLRAKAVLLGDSKLIADLDRLIINMEEDFHAKVEHEIIPIFDAMRRHDLSFYSDPILCGQFMHFLSLQNLRTKAIRNKVFSRAKEQFGGTEKLGFSIERAWSIVTHMSAVVAGGNLLVERDKRPLLLLENLTEVPFITGDQPVINLMASPNGSLPPTLLAFYYPISPTLAIILDEIEERSSFAAGLVSPEQALRLNRAIQDAAHKQIFASAEAILLDLMS